MKSVILLKLVHDRKRKEESYYLFNTSNTHIHQLVSLKKYHHQSHETGE